MANSSEVALSVACSLRPNMIYATYQWIIWVVRRLRYQNYGHWSTAIIFQVLVENGIRLRSALLIVDNKRRACAMKKPLTSAYLVPSHVVQSQILGQARPSHRSDQILMICTYPAHAQASYRPTRPNPSCTLTRSQTSKRIIPESTRKNQPKR